MFEARKLAILSLVAGLVLALQSGAASAQNAQDAPNPPLDANLFELVAGTWGWKESEASSCAQNPHTIVFEDNNTRAKLTFSKPIGSATGETTATTIYKILYAEKNKITMYIEGERRRTRAGDRVVWVLVLAGKNRYNWRRTDWPREDTTGDIVRCQPK